MVDLKTWNDLRTTTLVPGQKLVVKMNTDQLMAAKDTEANTPIFNGNMNSIKDIAKVNSAQSKSNGKYVYHTIQPGDTLFTIAQQYKGITVQMLKSANKISNARALRPGTKIKVPALG